MQHDEAQNEVKLTRIDTKFQDNQISTIGPLRCFYLEMKLNENFDLENFNFH